MKNLLTTLLLILYLTTSHSQNVVTTILWQNSIDTNGKKVLNFTNATYPDTLMFPYKNETLISNNGLDQEYQLQVLKTEVIPNDSLLMVSNIDKLTSDFVFIYNRISFSESKIMLMPLRKNSQTNEVEKITQYKLVAYIPISTQNHPDESLLKTGSWFKIKVMTDGVHKLSFAQLQSLGVSNPSAIRIYGYGSGMLSKNNADPRPSDLQEIPVQFNADHVLFFAQGSTAWTYSHSLQMFVHSKHHFSDGAYYFITSDLGRGLTIGNTTSVQTAATHTITSFDDYAFHEEELLNPCQAGSRWLGESFDSETPQSFAFSFPNIVGEAKIRTVVANESSTATSMIVNVNGSNIKTIGLDASSSSHDCSIKLNESVSSFTPSSSDIIASLIFSKSGNSTAKAYLDAITLNVKRQLSVSTSQLLFRDISTVGEGNVGTFILSNYSGSYNIWEISKINEVSNIIGQVSGSTFTFTLPINTLRQFVVFSASDVLTPVITGTDVGAVANQNLHGMNVPHMIIISHPNFISAAQKLAEHRRSQGLSVEIVTQDNIFNEFSSGTPDVQALRDFARMLYEKAPQTFKYLLLFGDGSYDNRPVSRPGNHNLIMSYHEDYFPYLNSDIPVTDDFFALLSPTETADSGFFDIGVGRIPAYTVEDADNVVNKLLLYDSPETLGSWRNQFTFLADDKEDKIFTFLYDANISAKLLAKKSPEFNINRIFLDAYKQYVTSSGQTCPDASLALHNTVHKGTMMLNFTGHGGPEGIMNEDFLNKKVINTWNNTDKMFVMFTASCKVSRFDLLDSKNAQLYEAPPTAGELPLLKEKGGAIAMVSSNRDTYADGNTNLNNGLVSHIVNRDVDDKPYLLGDIYKRAKNEAMTNPSSIGYEGKDSNTRNFSLLGDPSTRYVTPEMNVVVTDSINGLKPGADTLMALKEMTIDGHINDSYNNFQSDFNGTLFYSIYDKPVKWETIDNHGYGIESFYTQEQTIVRGKASVNNGKFSFTFLVPKDINYAMGLGKISYYAENSLYDVNGYFDSLNIGSIYDTIIHDDEGPQIKLFMNDTTFRNGGLTNDSPTLLAIISDPSGINATGASLGHDVTAFLDEDEDNKLILNEYYETDLNTYKSGKIKYDLNSLTPGLHSIRLKVWDALNNPSEATIAFLVSDGKELIISESNTYPNPMSNYTNFIFRHNMPDEELIITIDIYSISGQLIHSIKTVSMSSGFASEPILWDGSNAAGGLMANGIYIYKISAVSLETETKAISHGKFIIAK